MDKNIASSVNLLPELVFVVTVMLIICGAVCDRYEAHPVLTIQAVGLSTYLWYAFQNDEA